MELARREFLKESMATQATTDGKRFYSRYDVYYDDQALVEVMKLFKKVGVDAILHCGDVTDGGMVREMEFYKEAWDKVYGSDPRVYGYNVVVAGEDGTKLKKSVYARGYCMGIGYEPDGGVTTLEIPQSELPAGKLLSIAVRPCSSLATRGKPITTIWRS